MFQFLSSGALYLRFETCLECIIWHVSSYLRHEHKLLILSGLSDFVTCSESFNIQSEGFISQLWNTVGRYNLVHVYVNHTLIYTNCEQMLHLSDFVGKYFII